LAKRLGSWDMKFLGYDPYVSQETVAPLGIKMVALDDLLRESDVVTLHVVLTKETRGMIGLRAEIRETHGVYREHLARPRDRSRSGAA
jgi:D-3-phosphoglycerate dehydrogenase